MLTATIHDPRPHRTTLNATRTYTPRYPHRIQRRALIHATPAPHHPSLALHERQPGRNPQYTLHRRRCAGTYTLYPPHRRRVMVSLSFPTALLARRANLDASRPPSHPRHSFAWTARIGILSSLAARTRTPTRPFTFTHFTRPRRTRPRARSSQFFFSVAIHAPHRLASRCYLGSIGWSVGHTLLSFCCPALHIGCAGLV